MRFLISITVTAFILGLLACNSVERHLSSAAPANTGTSATTPPQADSVQRVTTADLKNWMDKGEAFVVDVRTKASYDAGHIPGSVLIPHKEVGSRIKDFPRDKKIVTYCS